jgi:hypothetical protein
MRFTRFDELEVGALFFDPMCGEHLRKTSTTEAVYLSGGDYFEGVLTEFSPEDEVTPEYPRYTSEPIHNSEDQTRL